MRLVMNRVDDLKVLSNPMNRLPQVFLVALLALVGPNQVLAQTAEHVDGQWVVRSSQRLNADGISSLMVDRFTGTVQVKGTTGSSIVITDEIRFDRDSRSQAEREARRIAPEASRRGSVLIVSGRHSDTVDMREVVIEVPSGFNVELDSPAGNGIVRDMNGNVDIGTGAGNVFVENVGGTLKIRSGAGTVSVKGVRLETRIRTGGGQVRVENVQSRLNVVTGGGDVDLSAVEGDIDVTTGGGTVTLVNAGGNATIYTGGGDIEIRGLAGRANLSTSGGNIEMNDVRGSVEATTSGGDIEGNRLASTIHVETMAGDIDLRDTHAGVRARSEVGDISIYVAEDGLGPEDRIEVRASHGDVEMVLPAGIRASVVADAGANGEVEIEAGNWKLVESERRLGRDRSLRRIEFLLGGGGGNIVLESNWGDIEIRSR